MATPPRALTQALPDLTAVLDVVPEPVVIAARGDGTVIYENDASIAKFGSIIGRPVEVLLPAALHARHAAHRARYHERPTPLPMGSRTDLVALASNGETIPVKVSLTPLPAAVDAVLAIVVDLRDDHIVADAAMRRTRALERALERELAAIQHLEQINDASARLIGTVAHELRTPVTIIHGVLETLAGQPGMPDDRRDALWESLVANVDRLTSIVTDLTGLADARHGRIEPSLTAVAVATEIDRIRRRRGYDQVTVDRSPDHMAKVDPLHLEQVVVNLLDNAERYAPGPVRVTTDLRDDRVLVHLDDTGPGLSPELRQAVFEPFARAQLPNVTTPGLGIGLALCRSLLELGDGSIVADANPAGQGARFTLSLPVA